MLRGAGEEYQILKFLGDNDMPLGSGTISEKMKMMNVQISEATIGRYLRNLDARGLTKKVGYQGRILTQAGKKFLEDHENEKYLQTKSHYMIRLARAGAKDELLHILVARRAIEKETCRLAVEKVTDEDILLLSDIVAKHLENISKGMSGANEDTAFHKTIARISGNKFLATALDLIRQDGQLSPVFEYIRKQVGSTVVADHKKVLTALENRNPAEAEKAMASHIENVILDVKKYWDIVNNHDQGSIDSKHGEKVLKRQP